MSFYLLQISYNATAIKAMVEHPHDRAEAARKGIDSLGGKMHAFYFAFGPYDVVAIADFPTTCRPPQRRWRWARPDSSRRPTTVLMTAAESVEAMRKTKSVSFKPPQ